MPKIPWRTLAPVLLILLLAGIVAGGYFQVQRQQSSQEVTHALMTNNLKALRQALDHGADADATNQHGSTVVSPWGQVLILFHFKENGLFNRLFIPALCNGPAELHSPPAVQLLLSHGANPNIRDSGGQTPLMGMVETSENFEDTMEMSNHQYQAPTWAVAADQKNAAACASIVSLLKGEGRKY